MPQAKKAGPGPLADKAERIADGAKPGDSQAVRSDEGYNADERSAAREKAPYVLGGVTFYRRRKNWSATRELRDLLRQQERAMIRQQRLRKQIVDAPADADEEGIFALEDQMDKLGDESDDAAYRIVALLLRDEAGESPDLEMLKEQIDVDDIGNLAGAFASGGEAVSDPTETSTS